jgi:protocatechuate 3,4-dioxygenase beta subunit
VNPGPNFDPRPYCHAIGSLWLLILFSTALQSAEPETPAVKFREVRVRVVNESGRPMPSVMVYLVGPGRDAPNNPEAVSESPNGWRFLSDAQGYCVARLGCFRGFDSEKLTGSPGPGWGSFYFMAEADGLRGVSPCIVHETPSEHRKEYWQPDEWSRHGFAETSSKRLEITLRMRRGIQVVGTVIDTEGRPVKDCAVSIQEDLHSESHTGYGGEIFCQSTFTDHHGHFVFSGVFPNTFYPNCASLNEGTLPVWLRTRVHSRWVDEPIYAVTPHPGEKVVRLTFEVSPRLIFRYYGKVVDQAGRPVPGAGLDFGISRHHKPKTFEDDHHFLHATADENGRYELRTATPFLRFLSVRAPGFADYEMDFEETGQHKLKSPGPWTVTLRRPELAK